MLKEEYYEADEVSGESTASLTEEWLKEDKPEADKIRKDIARTLEGIDTITQNRYLDSKILQPIMKQLHSIEYSLILKEKEVDPNRMDSIDDLDPAYTAEYYEKQYLKQTKEAIAPLYTRASLKQVRELIGDDKAYTQFLKSLIKKEIARPMLPLDYEVKDENTLKKMTWVKGDTNYGEF